MKTHICLGGLAVLALCLCTIAYAGEAEHKMPKEQMSSEHKVSDAMSTSEARRIASANHLLGAPIRTRTGNEEIGKVQDIVLDEGESRIAYIVMSHGGLMGMGGKSFAVPWSAFHLSGARDMQLSLDIDAERLKAAPAFDVSNWTQLSNPSFVRETHEFFGQRPYMVSGRAQSQDESALWDAWSARDATWARRLTGLIGTPVESHNREDIAELEDVVIDTREGRAVYGIVSYGGLMGMFDSRAAVPFDALAFQPERKVLALNGDLEDLEALTVKADDYSELDQTQFAQRVHQRFDTQPYWVVYGYVPAEAEQPAAQTAKTVDRYAKVTQSGTIESIGTYYPSHEGAEPGLRIRLRTAEGTSTVHIPHASQQQLQAKNITLSRGDTVTITGTSESFRGRRVIQAKELEKGGETVTLQQPMEEKKEQGMQKKTEEKTDTGMY